MNVGELKAKLAELPDDMPLYVGGYEGGVADLRGLDHVVVKLNANEEWYYGPHEPMDMSDSDGPPDGEGYVLR